MSRRYFLKAAEMIAGYMSIFNKDFVTIKELSNWTNFIKEKMKEKYTDAVILNKVDLTELKDEYWDLFIVFNEGVGIAKDVSIDDIREEICADTNIDILFTMCLSAKEYENKSKNEENEELAM